MLITIDTNVIYQALRNQGASYYILKLIRYFKINLALSVPVFQEYEDVLNRQKTLHDIGLDKSDIANFLSFLAFVGKTHTPYFLFRPNLRDENDNIFIELAFCSNSKYLITSNIRDYQVNNNLKFNSFEIITPSDFLHKWKQEYE